MRIIPLFFLACLFFTGCQQEEVKEIEIEKVIEGDASPGMIHTVFFWMNEDVDEAGERAFKDALMELEAIPSVKRMFVGPAAATADRDVTDNSFDYSLILWFDDIEGQNAYQVHPIHTAFAEGQGPKFSKVIVYDSDVE